MLISNIILIFHKNKLLTIKNGKSFAFSIKTVLLLHPLSDQSARSQTKQKYDSLHKEHAKNLPAECAVKSGRACVEAPAFIFD
jgi:hypothetical protein